MIKKKNKKAENKSNTIVESKKTELNKKEVKLQDKLLELEDSEIEALFEAGRITQDEFEYIIEFRKKKKARKKSQQEKFEERIRCDNTIIEKVINLGRKFRIQELLAKGNFEEAKKIDINKEFLDKEPVYEIVARDKQKEERLKQKYIDRNSRSRGRERDSR